MMLPTSWRNTNRWLRAQNFCWVELKPLSEEALLSVWELVTGAGDQSWLPELVTGAGYRSW